VCIDKNKGFKVITKKYKKLEEAENIVHSLAYKMLYYKRQINDLQFVDVINKLRHVDESDGVSSYDFDDEIDYKHRYKFLQENYINESAIYDLESVMAICKKMITEIKKADVELSQNNLRDAVQYNVWDV